MLVAVQLVHTVGIEQDWRNYDLPDTGAKQFLSVPSSIVNGKGEWEL